MTDVFTTAKGLDQQTIGGNVGTWGTILNTNLGLLDQAIGGTLFLSISTNTTLSASQAQNTGYEFTGALSGNVTVTWPPYMGAAFIFNNTTGAHSIIVGLAAGATVTIPNATTSLIWSDGTQFLAVSSTGGGGSTTGSGATVLQTSPTLITPVIGVASGTSLALSGALTGASETITGNIAAGSLNAGAVVLPKTANYTVTTSDVGKYLTNALATGTVVLTLPAVAVGLKYTFSVIVPFTLQIVALASTTIAIGTTVSATAGNIQSNSVYSSVTLLGVSNAAWVAVASSGAWTVT